MFGEFAFLDPSIAEASTSQNKTKISVGKSSGLGIYEGPSHTLPPAHILFDGFMQEILAGGSISLAVEPEVNGIMYEQPDGGMDGVEEDVVEKRIMKSNGGGEDIKELEEFFKGLLKSGGGKTNGHHVPNGVNGAHGVSGVNGDVTPEAKSMVGINGSTPSKSREAEQGEEDRVISASGGESGKKGKKRRAPIDLE